MHAVVITFSESMPEVCRATSEGLHEVTMAAIVICRERQVSVARSASQLRCRQMKQLALRNQLAVCGDC